MAVNFLTTLPMNGGKVAARGVIADLQDRRGIKQELSNVDEQIRVEIVKQLAEIIREAMK